MLGWARTDGVDGTQRDFYIRQLWDGKGSAVVEAMKPSAMKAYARCAAGPWLAPTRARVTAAAIAALPRIRRRLRPRPRRLRRELRGPERAGPRCAQACGGVRQNHGHRGLIHRSSPSRPGDGEPGSVSPVFIEPSPWTGRVTPAAAGRSLPWLGSPRAAARAHVHRARPVAAARRRARLPGRQCRLRSAPTAVRRVVGAAIFSHSAAAAAQCSSDGAPASRASSAAQPTRRAARTA